MNVHGWGATSIEESPREFSFSGIEIPVLLTFNLNDSKSKFNSSINIGPFLGYGLNNTEGGISPFPELYRFNYGYNLSVGFGSKKWQISCYLLKGLRNTAKQDALKLLEKVKSYLLGFNLTRIIRLSKKDSESNEE